MPEILEYGKGTVRVTVCSKCHSTLSYIPSEVSPATIQSFDSNLGASYKVKQGDYIRCPVCAEHTKVCPDMDMTLETYEITTSIEVTDA